MSPAAAGDGPLPRGRHKLPPEAVEASQRERLLRAMAELVGELGYEATTVPKIVAAARVSSNTFYRFFADKTDCFIALCEQLGEELFTALTAPPDGSTLEDARRGLDAGLSAYLNWWPERPALARAYFVELPSAGPRAIAERDRQYARFGLILRHIAQRARELRPELPPLREVDLTAAVIVARELVAREIREGRVAQLGELEPDLRYILVRLLVDDQAARAMLPGAVAEES